MKVKILFAICLLLIATASFAELSDTDATRVNALLQKQADNFLRLKGIKYKSTTRMELTKDAAEYSATSSNVLVNECIFNGSGEKFYSEVSAYADDPNNKYTIKEAFNSQKYQYKKRARIVVRRNADNNLIYGTESPLVKMYSFAIGKDENNSIFVFSNSNKWTQLSKYAESIKATEMLGHKGYAIKFVGPASGPAGYNECNVFFAEDLGFYPIYCKSKIAGSARSGEKEVVSTQVISTEAGDIIIPMIIRSKSYYNGVLDRTSETTIDADSLMINGAIDESVFTLVPEKGDTYTDVDAGLEYVKE